MAVTFRAKTLTTATGTSASGTEPTGTVSGDMIIALSIAAAVISQPAGWTQLFKATQGSVSWVVSYVVRGGSAPNLGWTWAGSVYYELHLMTMKPASGSVAFDAVSGNGATGNSGHDPDPGAVVPVAGTSLAVCGGVNFGSVTAWTAPAGYTVQTTNTGGIDAAMCTKSLSSTASENPAAITNGAPTGDWWDGFAVTFTDVAASGDTQEWMSRSVVRQTRAVNPSY